MDSGQNPLKCEIPQIGKSLVEILQAALCPAFVRYGENIMLTAPWDEADYRIGIYLYDIQDYSDMSSQGIMENENERRFPPKAVELSYMIFCNENNKFGGIRREQIHTLLNEIVRTVYDYPLLTTGYGEEVQISFARENLDYKIRLWESFGKPLQPAVYIKAVPVLINSGRLDKVTKVKDRDYRVGRKG